MPVLACPKCKKPFCAEPTEASLQNTLMNLGILMKGKRVIIKRRFRKPKIAMLAPPSGIQCAFCQHKFKIDQAVRLV